MKQHEVISLKIGIAIPFLYFGSILAAALFYPGFTFLRQFASELGADGAPHPHILNFGIIMVGVATLIATFGYWRALYWLGARPVLSRLTCYILAMFGVAMLMAGIFPLPNYLMHSGFGLGLPILFGPVLLAAALKERGDARRLRNFLLVTNILMVVVLVFYVGATHSKVVGLAQLLYSLTAIPWIGVSAHVLSSSVARASHERTATAV